MNIRLAWCKSKEFGITRFDISKEQEDEIDGESYIYVDKQSPIAEAIHEAAKQPLPNFFKCNGVEYELIYIVEEEEKTEVAKEEINIDEEGKAAPHLKVKKRITLRVYTERCRCTKCYSEYGFDCIANLRAMIPIKGQSIFRSVEVHRCSHCLRLFMDKNSLDSYRERYGEFDVAIKYITGNEPTFYMGRDSYIYAESTVLSRNGYSAQNEEWVRREVLKNILEKNLASKSEIKDILTRFITDRGYRYPVAKAAWKSDLLFVNEFGLHKEEKLEFEDIVLEMRK